MNKQLIKSSKKSLLSNQRGGTDLLETLILVAFIAIVAVVGVRAFGGTILNKFGEGATAVETNIDMSGGLGDGTGAEGGETPDDE